MSSCEFLENGRRIIASLYELHPPSVVAVTTGVSTEDKSSQTDMSSEPERHQMSVDVSVNQFSFPPQNIFTAADAPAATLVSPEPMVVQETLAPVDTAPTLTPLEPVVADRQMMSQFVDKCYHCMQICMHICRSCKVPCHSSIRKCSKMIEEGVFECFLCAGYPSVEQPSQPSSLESNNSSCAPNQAPKRDYVCPKCKKTYSKKCNLTRHQDLPNSTCRP